MAIYYYLFKTPLNLSDQSQFDLESSLLFAQKTEMPPGFVRDITPEGYRDKYRLRTRIDQGNKKEDTIGEVEVNRQGGKKISSVSIGREGEGPSLRETENETVKLGINAENPTFVLARPNALDGGEGVRIDAVIRYEKSA